MAEQYTYRNVTISGLPGCGSTTLLRLLEEELGWKGYSGGEFMRAYAQEKGYFPKDATVHHDASAYPDDFDRQVDYGVREKLTQDEKLIMEAWLSGFLAQGVSGVLKVLVTCSDDAVRIDRIVNRDNVSIDEAKAHIKAREAKNREKWAAMYAQEWDEWVVKSGTVPQSEEIDFWNPKLYDLVIDTYSNSREETLRKVVQALRGT
jgi:cytidylate kinase